MDGTTYLAHEVGTGKTATIAASVMEARRMGFAKKPVIAVPKDTLDQMSADFLQLYPGANILVIKVPGIRAQRKKALARIATGNWDAVIMTHGSFNRIPISDEAQADFLRRQLRELEIALTQMEHAGLTGRSVSQVRARRDALEERIQHLLHRERDDVPTFEEMGIDMLAIDEAHVYKNLHFETQYRNVRGLGSASQTGISMDTFM